MDRKSSYSQVFLNDTEYIHRISKSINCNGSTLVEIGPGRGQLTQYLAAKGKQIYCIEIDTTLAALLKKKFPPGQITIINKDIMRFDLSTLGNALVVCGNIPYHISTDIIYYLIHYRLLMKRVYLTVQKEFAEKLAAVMNTKAYGFLTCYVQYFARVTIHFQIPKTAFSPTPKVDSAFIEINFLPETNPDAQFEEHLFKIIKTAFCGRRKKILNSLAACYDKDRLKKMLAASGIGCGCRPENISLSQYCSLAEALWLEKIAGF